MESRKKDGVGGDGEEIKQRWSHWEACSHGMKEEKSTMGGWG